MKSLSVIIPCFNEEAVIQHTYQKLKEQLERLSYRYEIIFVDDGSSDETYQILTSIKASDRKVALVKLSRNFGKEGVIAAGLELAKGDFVALMDADLQDPPSLLPEMLKRLETGDDQVGTYRSSRKSQTFLTSIFSNLYYHLFNSNAEFKVHPNEREYRLMNRKVVQAILQHPEKQRYIKNLWNRVGFKTSYIGYEDIERFAGKTKYSFKKKFKLAIHNVVASSPKPMDGILKGSVLYWGVLSVYSVYAVFNQSVNLGLVVLWILALQFAMLSLLAIYGKQIYDEVKQRPMYLIDEVLESEL
jgi:glucosyltransferase